MMKNLKERWKRVAAIGLAAAMMTAQLPVTSFAEETVKQETAAEPATTREMTDASEAPEQPEDKTASETPEQTEDKTASETPVEAAVSVEQPTPAEAADNGSEDLTEKQDAQESDTKDTISDGDK